MLEPKALFASKGEVPAGEHYVPFGVARIARAGDAIITIVAAGQMVPRRSRRPRRWRRRVSRRR